MDPDICRGVVDVYLYLSMHKARVGGLGINTHDVFAPVRDILGLGRKILHLPWA